MEFVSETGDFGGGNVQSETVACPSGKVVIGGGVLTGRFNGNPTDTHIEKIHVSSSFPISTTEWKATMYSQDEESSYKWEVYAICIDEP